VTSDERPDESIGEHRRAEREKATGLTGLDHRFSAFDFMDLS
jgi:hypothetical protein